MSTAAGAARGLLAAACLGLSLLVPAPSRAQEVCGVDAGGFRVVVPGEPSAQLRLQGAAYGGRVQISGPRGICFLYLRRPTDAPPEPLEPMQDDVERRLLAQIRRAEVYGVDIDYAMPVPETSLGGLPMRLGWTQLRDEGRLYAADTLLDPATGAHVAGICALRDLGAATLAEAFLRSVHLEPSSGLPKDCQP